MIFRPSIASLYLSPIYSLAGKPDLFTCHFSSSPVSAKQKPNPTVLTLNTYFFYSCFFIQHFIDKSRNWGRYRHHFLNDQVANGISNFFPSSLEIWKSVMAQWWLDTELNYNLHNWNFETWELFIKFQWFISVSCLNRERIKFLVF